MLTNFQGANQAIEDAESLSRLIAAGVHTVPQGKALLRLFLDIFFLTNEYMIGGNDTKVSNDHFEAIFEMYRKERYVKASELAQNSLRLSKSETSFTHPV